MTVGRLGLGLKFSLAVTALIVLTMTGVATLVISFQKNALRESSAQNALAMTRNLAHDAAGPLLVFDPLRLDEMVRTVQEATSSAYAMVTDRGGMVVAHTRRSQLGGKADSWPATPGPDSETVREIATEAGTVREYTIPVPRVGGEEARLRQLFGDSYARYCADVRRFLPGLPRPGQPVAIWDWKLFRQNHGPLNLARTLVVWLAVAVWLHLRPM